MSGRADVLSVLGRTPSRMTPDPQTVAWLDQEDAHPAQTIRAHRWAVQYVGEGAEPDEPAFGYTIGLGRTARRRGAAEPGEVVLATNRFYERPADYSVPAYRLTLGPRRWRLPLGRRLPVRARAPAAARTGRA